MIFFILSSAFILSLCTKLSIHPIILPTYWPCWRYTAQSSGSQECGSERPRNRVHDSYQTKT